VQHFDHPQATPDTAGLCPGASAHRDAEKPERSAQDTDGSPESGQTKLHARSRAVRGGAADERPGRRVRTGQGEAILLGRTATGRYAFARSPHASALSGRSEAYFMDPLQARLLLGLAIAEARRPHDRRGPWGRRS